VQIASLEAEAVVEKIDAVARTGPSGADATAFELALLAMDAKVIATQKRMREQDIDKRRLLRKELGEPYPFQDQVDVLNGALQQVAVLCNTEVPDYFDLNSDPRRVKAWVTQTISADQRTQFALGQAKERAISEPRFSPQVTLEIMRCCTRLNELLSTPDPAY
jgi:hypothetical protein